MSAISKTTDRVVIAIDPHKASWTTIGLFEGNVLGGGVGGARHLFAGVGAETGQIELGTPSRATSSL